MRSPFFAVYAPLWKNFSKFPKFFGQIFQKGIANIEKIYYYSIYKCSIL